MWRVVAVEPYCTGAVRGGRRDGRPLPKANLRRGAGYGHGARIALAGLLLAVAAFAGSGHDPVLAVVGSTELRASAVRERFAATPEFVRRRLGQTLPEQLYRYIDDVLVHERLLAFEAERLGLAETAGLRAARDDILRQALAQATREALSAQIAEEQLKEYYAAHPEYFSKPAAIRIWRILTPDEGLARRIIEACGGVDGPKRWRQFARENSVDTSTNLRGGDLGFVYPDGKTQVPQLRVDPELFQAAQRVEDGALVPVPIREKDRYAVVWRRGSTKAHSASYESQRAAIREVLERQALLESTQASLDQLRKSHLSEVRLDRVRELELPEFEPIPSQPRPVAAPRASTSADPPSATERGLR